MAYNSFSKTNMIDTDYLDQLRDGLVPKLVTEGITTSIVEIIPGIKNVMTLNSVSNTITVQDAACGFDPAGDVALRQRELRVYPKAVNDVLCPKDLEQIYLGMYMKNNKEIPFTEIFAESYINKVNAWNENFIWDGDGTVGGLINIIETETGVIDRSVAVGAASGYITQLEALMAGAPAEVFTSDEGVVFCTFEFYNGYMNELRAANLYNLANTEYKNGGWVTTIPGTNVRLVATAGLTNITNNTVATGSLLVYTTASNLVVGTDMLNDEEMFDMWYSRDNDEYRINIQWKIGVGVRFPEFVVKGYTLS